MTDKIDAQKSDCNRRAKQSLCESLRAKTWAEKVKAIERMNVATQRARGQAQDEESQPQLTPLQRDSTTGQLPCVDGGRSVHCS